MFPIIVVPSLLGGNYTTFTSTSLSKSFKLMLVRIQRAGRFCISFHTKWVLLHPFLLLLKWWECLLWSKCGTALLATFFLRLGQIFIKSKYESVLMPLKCFQLHSSGFQFENRKKKPFTPLPMLTVSYPILLSSLYINVLT